MKGDGPTDTLSRSVIRCVFKVHNQLGPGFLENVYKRALTIELLKQGLRAEVEKEVSIYYDGVEVGRHRIDIVVEERLIVELKVVDAMGKAHYAQVRSYLKATGFSTGLLVNFADISADIRRIENHPPKHPQPYLSINRHPPNPP